MTSDVNDGSSLLSSCCIDRQPAQMILESEGVAIRGVFHELEDERIVLMALSSEDTAGELALPATCCVTFHRNDRTFAFVTTVREQWNRGPSGNVRHFALDRPELVAAAETRRSLRIPVSPSVPLSIKVTHPEQVAQPAFGVNISHDGLCVGLVGGPEATKAFPTGSKVTLSIELEKLGASIDATVVYNRGSALGLHFTDLDSSNSVLGEIVAKVESVWLEEQDLVMESCASSSS